MQHARSDVEGAFYDWACFSAQQAAEKAVKALFQRMGAVVWGHSVADLLDELAQQQEVPENIRDAALELDKAYIPSRYPERIRLALHGVATSVQKRKGWSSMPQRSSGSVKVFYPPWTREALLVRLREGVAALHEVLPLVRVVLFRSYARGRQTVASDIDLLVVYAGAVRGDAYALIRYTLNLRRWNPMYTQKRNIHR